MTGGAAGLAGQSGHATPSLTPIPGSSLDTSTISSNLPVKPSVEQQESRLLAYLMQNYDRQVRPLTNHNGNITVHVGITLTQIFDMVRFAFIYWFFEVTFCLESVEIQQIDIHFKQSKERNLHFSSDIKSSGSRSKTFFIFPVNSISCKLVDQVYFSIYCCHWKL